MPTFTTAELRSRLQSVKRIPLGSYPTPVEEMVRLRVALGGGPHLLVKRDDAIAFAFGGNKVRKAQIVVGEAIAEGADTLITTGGLQSNHARVTAAAAARLGLRCVLVVNGARPDRLTGNALLDDLLGAEVQYVASRDDRVPAMAAAAERLAAEGRRPVIVPLGASTPSGALGFVDGLVELCEQMPPPDVIVHSTSSGGTQAGLAAGCALLGLATRVIGVSADESASALTATIRDLMAGLEPRLSVPAGSLAAAAGAVTVDDGFVGDGYGLPTAASSEALMLAARTEGLFLDSTYTAKAMAGLIARIRAGEFAQSSTVLFWHTGGQVGLFS